MRTWIPALALAVAVAPVPRAALALPAPPASIVMNGESYATWHDWVTSDGFRQNGLRCGTHPSHVAEEGLRTAFDCTLTYTNPTPQYDPGPPYTLTLVFHVITNSAGTQGNISNALIQSQVDILNEDYQAMAGTNGENGNDAAIHFQLATVDPDGNPTNGITHSANTTWFNDNGSYWNTLAWDPVHYVNVYTNLCGGYLGYVPDLPQGGIVGSSSDRIVVLWSSVGRNAPIGPPYDQGRTLTHEMGHYLGLWHPFDNGCGTSSCYNTGDYICDTNKESSPTYGCPTSRVTCGEQAPKENYMDYSDDLCMEKFTVEQVRRIRCTLQYYRPDLSPSGMVGVAETFGTGSVHYLAQNEPNPFAGATRIRFDLPESGPVSLRVIDVAGRTVRTLVTGSRNAGANVVGWDGRDAVGAPVAAGVYFYRLETRQGSETRRMVRLD